MDAQKDLETFLGEIMSADATEINAPHPALLWEAREKIMARKKVLNPGFSFFDRLIAFFRLDFKFYHVGLSVLLICAGIFYVNEPSYNNGSNGGFMQYKESLSISNTTISVISSTMLTSIPTTVIRN